MGNLIELSAITAVVVGGTPLTGGKVRIAGTVAGALLLQLITATLIRNNLSDSTSRMVAALIILGAVYLQRDQGRIMTASSPIDRVRSEAPVLPLTGAGAVSATRRERLAALIQRTGAFVVLIVVTLLGTIAFGPRFASVDNFLNIIEASSFLALVAVGMTFVIIGGGIDLSGGSMLALAAVLAAFAAQCGESLAAIALPLLVGGAIGLVNGLLIARGRMAPVHRDPGRPAVRARTRVRRRGQRQHRLHHLPTTSGSCSWARVSSWASGGPSGSPGSPSSSAGSCWSAPATGSRCRPSAAARRRPG